MSTLEKAFLKAMSLEAEENDSDNKNKAETQSQIVAKKTNEDLNLEKLNLELGSSQVKETHEIVLSRTGISRMEEMTPFSSIKLIEKRLIYANMLDKQLLDRYRNIRTKLLSQTKNENFVTLVTSVIPCENSGLIAANLAATFSLDEAKTSMLVEADIGNPTLNQLFEMKEENGLIEYLESDSLDSNHVLHKTGVPRLSFVPSGIKRENSAEYFTSTKMAEFVKELVGRYPDRYPIINAPCVINSADTRILIELCEKVVLVVPYGRCSDEEIMQAALAIGEKKLAGVVLDDF